MLEVIVKPAIPKIPSCFPQIAQYKRHSALTAFSFSFFYALMTQVGTVASIYLFLGAAWARAALSVCFASSR
jgi:hypothetical protein